MQRVLLEKARPNAAMPYLEYLNALRKEELNRVVDRHPALFENKDLLEIGSGTGAQLRLLAHICRSAVGIELSDSRYLSHSVADIHPYDGRSIPFPDAMFDAIFSSNVMEHVREPAFLHQEMKRVLRRGGIGIHIMPTHHWRLWTSLSHYPAVIKKRVFRQDQDRREIFPAENLSWRARLANALISDRHGESGNRFTEYFLFHPDAWRRRFEDHGWAVETVEPIGLAYTGNCLFGERLSWRARSRWARLLGSSTVLLIVHPR